MKKILIVLLIISIFLIQAHMTYAVVPTMPFPNEQPGCWLRIGLNEGIVTDPDEPPFPLAYYCDNPPCCVNGVGSYAGSGSSAGSDSIRYAGSDIFDTYSFEGDNNVCVHAYKPGTNSLYADCISPQELTEQIDFKETKCCQSYEEVSSYYRTVEPLGLYLPKTNTPSIPSTSCSGEKTISYDGRYCEDWAVCLTSTGEPPSGHYLCKCPGDGKYYARGQGSDCLANTIPEFSTYTALLALLGAVLISSLLVRKRTI